MAWGRRLCFCRKQEPHETKTSGYTTFWDLTVANPGGTGNLLLKDEVSDINLSLSVMVANCNAV